jgi:cholinesterase
MPLRILILSAGFVAILLTLASALPAMDVEPIVRIYVFGDSYSDTGAGYVDGDGPTAVAYLAKLLGIDLVPATANGAADASLNFAVSGAGTGRASGKHIKDALLGLGMLNQIEDFCQRVHTARVTFKPERTLFFLAGGLNDGQLRTKATIENLEKGVRLLHQSGARRFSIALLPTAIPAFSEVGKRLNPALRNLPGQLAALFPDSTFILSSWGPAFDDVLQHPGRYGIANAVDACAGRALFGQDPRPCAKPASYFYYHEGHPSTAVHKIVGQKLYGEFRGQQGTP